MDVILLERVAKLGQMGEVVKVKEGYARNYLLPQGKALRANEANLRRFEDQKSNLEARNLETKKEAESLARRLDGESYVIIRQASDGGALYGSVTPRDIADAAAESGMSIDKRQVVLAGPIKELGLHTVALHLHPEVEAEITINVARSPEEAELQASGRSIRDIAAEEEARSDYEVQQLFDDIGGAAEDARDEQDAQDAQDEVDDLVQRATAGREPRDER